MTDRQVNTKPSSGSFDSTELLRGKEGGPEPGQRQCLQGWEGDLPSLPRRPNEVSLEMIRNEKTRKEWDSRCLRDAEAWEW